MGFYNKDIFDKFGVPYPKDGMTWDDAFELAKKITREDGGTKYVGFLVHTPLMLMYNQLSLPFLDPKADRAAFTNDKWRVAFENFKRFYEIPGNPYTTAVDDFPKGYAAMAVHVSEKMIGWKQVNPQLNMDFMSVPTFKEAPGTGLQPNVYSLFVSSVSKHKDAAFEAIAHLLSDEVQTQLSKKGLVTPLVNKEPASRTGGGEANLL